jgi:hypothetical protein
MADPKQPTTKPAEHPAPPAGVPDVQGIPPWKEPPGSVLEPPQAVEAAAHVEIPPWQEPPDDPETESVHVLTGEFAGRPMRFAKDVAAQAIAEGWAKKHGDPDPQLDEDEQVKARHASHEAITKLRNKRQTDAQEAQKKSGHQTREMQSGKSEEPYRTRQSTPPPKR